MLRSIYEGVLDAMATALRGRRAPGTHGRRRAGPRRLTMESLEGRRLLTTTTLTVNSVSDGNFAAPSLAPEAYQLDPGSSPWQFSGSAGVSANLSGFTVGNPAAPDGAQVGFIKDLGSASQTVYLEAGVYGLSMYAAQRFNYQTQPQEIEVLVDGVEAGVIVPSGTTYAPYESANFSVATTGAHSVELLGLIPAAADSTAFIDDVAITPVVDTLVDGDFGQENLAVNTYVTDPSGVSWQFSGTAGVAANGSSFTANSSTTQLAPQGTEVAYVQDTGSINQTVYLDAGTYQVSFQSAQRAIFQTNYQEIEILVDGQDEGLIDPTSTGYAEYQSSTFTVAAGAHVVEFLGLNPEGGDDTAFLDEVTLTAANAVSDGNFATPALQSPQYQYAPGGSAWTFSGGSGISTNGSAVTTGNPGAPDGGTQVGFLKGISGMSQPVMLAAGSYDLSFEAAQRSANTDSQGQEVEVLVDSAVVGLIVPVGTSYSLYETPSFTVAGGTHTIQLVGLDPLGGDDTALIDLVSLTASQDEVVDGGFETPVLASASYMVEPSGTPWQFSGLAGISGNGSALTSGSPVAPQGAQVGFLMNNASMSYTEYLDPGTYNLSFLAAQRAKFQSQSQTIEVLVDGADVGSITPASTTYSMYETSNFTVAAGVHTIEFLGQSPQNASSTAFIDQVELTFTENTFSDGGFESPVLAVDSYAIAPSGSGWQYSGIAGVTANSSAFTIGGDNAPDGNQVAFIKDNGGISQTVYFTAGTCSVSFLAAQRLVYQSQNQEIEVLVDGSPIGVIAPDLTNYLSYQSPNFSVTAGPHTVELLGMSPASSDSTIFIDDAAVVAGGAISGGSFDTPVLAPKAYEIAPAGTPWSYSGDAGVSTNDSGFTAGNPDGPDGAQVAFIKESASISQSAYLGSGIYNLSFMAAQRADYQAQSESLDIFVDGELVGSVTAASTTYGLYQTSTFTVSAGVHTIEFLGVNPSGGDDTVFISDVQLSG
jgi:hypothetical protein